MPEHALLMAPPCSNARACSSSVIKRNQVYPSNIEHQAGWQLAPTAIRGEAKVVIQFAGGLITCDCTRYHSATFGYALL